MIHAGYAAGWALVSLAAGGSVSPLPAIAFLILAIGLTVIAARRLRARPAMPEALEPQVARWVRRVNIVTAVAALLYGWVLSSNGQDGRAIAAVLVVLGAHFLPMGWLLRRPSLPAMGAALIVIGLFVWVAPVAAATGAFFAALVFAGSAIRLLMRSLG
ncbi:hypothetical protein Q4F19_05375 [Sphingomonas sp. BIUV-7]|uniref:Uncharacterized protein n=1 Tax=Sphingomonas natans TaxID=3063330 RepID=A0ABT8Y7Y1_9SPHN|nr:hypothetical protein [Sphingomonas sp. BIUV-7]MDO6413805.1 hypothetical protein [Sphingomonas sp. BIUV-7]